MTAYLADMECLVPSSIEEALRQRAVVERLIPIAGGTDIMVGLYFGILTGTRYQSLHRLEKDWRYIRRTDDGSLSLGALTTYTDIRHHPCIQKHYPLLVEAARVTGALQIQNRGTLVGNIANGSPAADSVPALLVYDALLRLVSESGERRVSLESFLTGYRQNVLRRDELIAEIILPPCRFEPPEIYYRKVGTRKAQAISKVVFAGARSRSTEEVKLAWGAVAPTTVRTRSTESAIAQGADWQQAWEVLQQEISPIDDIRSTRHYRLMVSKNLLGDFLRRTIPQ